MLQEIGCKNCKHFCTQRVRSQGREELEISQIDYCELGKDLEPCLEYKPKWRIKI